MSISINRVIILVLEYMRLYIIITVIYYNLESKLKKMKFQVNIPFYFEMSNAFR